MRYLLDTNACVHAMRGTPAMLDAMSRRAPTDLAASSITFYELHTGVQKCADPPREHAKVAMLFATLNHLLFDAPAALEAARIRAMLESRGEMIGPYDVLLAGQARSLGLILVSANTREFSRIPGLVLENWESPGT